MLKLSSVKLLKGRKNLLAFSGGGDSTALFFLLLKANISFDIAIVNYNIREQSAEEVRYAKELAHKYNLTCYDFDAPQIDKNFEANARTLRYSFFEELIEKHAYNNLLTAHHLGDRFEWMLMQFCKGAGCIELAGMQEVQEFKSYTLIRPLLHLDKPELVEFLDSNALIYFEDETNEDESIKRNYFRHQYSQPLLSKHLAGIKKSFQYIDEDRQVLAPTTLISTYNELAYFQCSDHVRGDIFLIDKYLKEKGLMITAKEREGLSSHNSFILGRKYLVTRIHNFICITPSINKQVKMEKDFKEECRILKVDPKMRPYLYENQEVFLKIKQLLDEEYH